MAIDTDEELRRAAANAGLPISTTPNLGTDEGLRSAAGDFIEQTIAGGGLPGKVNNRLCITTLRIGL